LESTLNIHANIPDIKFIVSGDFRQLPPVQDRAEFDYQNSNAIYELCNGTMVKLLHCRRSDKELFNYCLNVDTVDQSKFGNLFCEKSLCYRNSLRKQINKYWMNSKKGDDYIILEKNKGDKKFSRYNCL